MWKTQLKGEGMFIIWKWGEVQCIFFVSWFNIYSFIYAIDMDLKLDIVLSMDINFIITISWGRWNGKKEKELLKQCLSKFWGTSLKLPEDMGPNK